MLQSNCLDVRTPAWQGLTWTQPRDVGMLDGRSHGISQSALSPQPGVWAGECSTSLHSLARTMPCHTFDFVIQATRPKPKLQQQHACCVASPGPCQRQLSCWNWAWSVLGSCCARFRQYRVTHWHDSVAYPVAGLLFGHDRACCVMPGPGQLWRALCHAWAPKAQFGVLFRVRRWACRCEREQSQCLGVIASPHAR